jgi:hypothetical protein
MNTRNLFKKRLFRFWIIRLPNQEQLLERFLRVGLIPQDHNLSRLKLVSACSLMLEKRTIYDVYQSINRLNNESTETMLDDEFFARLDEITSELEMSGMRIHSRKLRKFGQGLASAQRKPAWESYWKKETDRKMLSAIKDEPFLPQQS